MQQRSSRCGKIIRHRLNAEGVCIRRNRQAAVPIVYRVRFQDFYPVSRNRQGAANGSASTARALQPILAGQVEACNGYKLADDGRSTVPEVRGLVCRGEFVGHRHDPDPHVATIVSVRSVSIVSVLVTA